MTGQAQVEKKRCFVLSPIGSDESAERKAADKVLKHLIKKSLGSDFAIERADENRNPGAITPQMIASILEADLIVADLSGYNPNVFYELAIAHGYAKPTVHIQVKGERPAFDIKDVRIVGYDMDPDELEAAQKLLREYAQFALNHPDAVQTPLTSAERFAAVRESTDPVAQSNVQVLDALQELRNDVRRLGGSRTRVARSPSTPHDLRSLRTIIERIVDDGRADEPDFREVVTPSTSTEFDNWAFDLFEKAFGSTNDDILMHPSVAEAPDDAEGSED